MQPTLFDMTAIPAKRQGMSVDIRWKRRGESDDAAKTATIKAYFIAGDFAVTGLFRDVLMDGTVTFYRGQYTINHIPSGRGGGVWFDSKKDAIAFCRWLIDCPPHINESGKIDYSEEIGAALRKRNGHLS